MVAPRDRATRLLPERRDHALPRLCRVYQEWNDHPCRNQRRPPDQRRNEAEAPSRARLATSAWAEIQVSDGFQKRGSAAGRCSDVGQGVKVDGAIIEDNIPKIVTKDKSLSTH